MKSWNCLSAIPLLMLMMGAEPTSKATNPDAITLKDHAKMKTEYMLKTLKNAQLKSSDITFNIGEGLLQLGSAKVTDQPQKFEGIGVSRKAARLHFLHACGYNFEPKGTTVGKYIIHYADKTTETIELISGRHFNDWWGDADDDDPLDATICWRGENDSAKEWKKILQLYHFTWKNPKPDKEIASLDFVTENSKQECAPFCVAITADLKADADRTVVAKNVNKDAIPLKEHFNEKKLHQLKSLPKGALRSGDVSFDIGDGFLQLGSASVTDKPEKIEGIKIDRKAAKLHFLQASSYTIEPVDTKVGTYIVYYTDKSREEINIVAGRNVADWWRNPDDEAPTEATIAWKGENELTKKNNQILRLYHFTWTNPHPDKVIWSLDFVAEDTKQNAAPFCLAITVEATKEKAKDK